MASFCIRSLPYLVLMICYLMFYMELIEKKKFQQSDDTFLDSLSLINYTILHYGDHKCVLNVLKDGL